MQSPGSITNSVPDLNRVARNIRDAERNAQEQASATSLQQSQIGAGGLLINGGGSLTISGGGSLNVAGGALNSAGAIAAGTTITAGTTVTAGGKLTGFGVDAGTGAIAGASVAVTGAASSATVATTGNATVGGDIQLTGDLYTIHGLNTPVTSGYFAAYINSDGRLGRSASARKYKQDITTFDPDVQAVFGMQLVSYRMKAAVTDMGDAAPHEYGLIAEELETLGLGWLVLYSDGAVEGIAYEKIALALIPAVQNHESRILALEAYVQSH